MRFPLTFVKAANSFAAISTLLHEGGPIIVSQPTEDLMLRRWAAFVESLHEWKTVCQRFDDDFQVFLESNEQLAALGNHPDEQQAMNVVRRSKEVWPKIRLDIRCVYIFAKITFITFAALLCEMAHEQKHAWKKLTAFRKIGRAHV